MSVLTQSCNATGRWGKSVLLFALAFAALSLSASVGWAQPQKGYEEEEAQEAFLQAMDYYDSKQFDLALDKLKEAEKAARRLPDAGWRKAVKRQLKEARIGVLYEAGLAAYRIESYVASYRYFDAALKLMSKSDSRRAITQRNLTQIAYLRTLRLWLDHKYDQARDLARDAQRLAKKVYERDSKMRVRLDDLHYKITMTHTDELVSRGEIQDAFRQLKKDFRVQPDPRFAYRLGELGWQLRAYTEAEKYFKRAKRGAKKGEGRGGEAALAQLLQDSEQKLVHIRSLKKRVTVRSNVPYYKVEVYRPRREKPVIEKEVEDPNVGIVLNLYPGRYRFLVTNPDYGVCPRENISVKRVNLDLDCDFERPPTAVSFDTTPSGVQVKVVPSTMVAFRRTPFYTELYRGSYTLLVRMEGIPDPVEIPFIVQREDTQEFHFDLEFGEIEVLLPEVHQDAQIKLDGKLRQISVTGIFRVTVGSHVVEVVKPGYLPIRQRIFVGPREIKSLLYSLSPIRSASSDDVNAVPSLEASFGYRGEYVRNRVTFSVPNEGGELSDWDNSFIFNEVSLSMNISLTSDPAAAVKPYIWVGGQFGAAFSNPIAQVLRIDGGVGAGILMDTWKESRWWADLSYQVRYTLWEDNFTDTAHTASVLQPVGIGLRGGGHYRFFHTDLNLAFFMGSGSRTDCLSDSENVDACVVSPGNPTSQAYTSDVDLMVLEAELFAGIDILDFFGYDPGLDLVFGVFGGVMIYDEEQTITGYDADLDALNKAPKEQGISILDGRAGARLRFLYTLQTVPRTSFVIQSDFRFVGGVHPTYPLIHDDKVTVEPQFGNFSFFGGVGLSF